jgi:chorismate mutase
LVKNIRPQLDEVQKSLIAELVNTVEIRKSKTCHADVAKAVGNYVSTHAQGAGPITEATLDRALAGACMP